MGTIVSNEDGRRSPGNFEKGKRMSEEGKVELEIPTWVIETSPKEKLISGVRDALITSMCLFRIAEELYPSFSNSALEKELRRNSGRMVKTILQLEAGTCYGLNLNRIQSFAETLLLELEEEESSLEELRLARLIDHGSVEILSGLMPEAIAEECDDVLPSGDSLELTKLKEYKKNVSEHLLSLEATISDVYADPEVAENLMRPLAEVFEQSFDSFIDLASI